MTTQSAHDASEGHLALSLPIGNGARWFFCGMRASWLAGHGETRRRLEQPGLPAVRAEGSQGLHALKEAVAEAKGLSDKLDGYCRAGGRDPVSVWRSVEALHPVPDPFSSLDAFDAYVGAFVEIGIDELIFCWPPIDPAFADPPAIPAERQSRFERIAAMRIVKR